MPLVQDDYFKLQENCPPNDLWAVFSLNILLFFPGSHTLNSIHLILVAEENKEGCKSLFFFFNMHGLPGPGPLVQAIEPIAKQDQPIAYCECLESVILITWLSWAPAELVIFKTISVAVLIEQLNSNRQQIWNWWQPRQYF